ncbi:hypothetical protein BDW68DRAFT_175908 [Aspergillus falconensis]
MLVNIDWSSVASERAIGSIVDLTTIQDGNPDLTWASTWHPATDDLFAAARLQKSILRTTIPFSITDLSSETTVIGLALHCLAVVYEFSAIDARVDGPQTEETFEDGSLATLLEPELDLDFIQPGVKVQQQRRPPWLSASPVRQQQVGFSNRDSLQHILSSR